MHLNLDEVCRAEFKPSGNHHPRPQRAAIPSMPRMEGGGYDWMRQASRRLASKNASLVATAPLDGISTAKLIMRASSYIIQLIKGYLPSICRVMQPPAQHLYKKHIVAISLGSHRESFRPSFSEPYSTRSHSIPSQVIKDH